MTEADAPTVYITAEAMNALDMYIDSAPDEISGFGTVVQEAPNVFLVDGIYIFEQESSAAETEMSGETIAKGIMALIEQGVDPEKMRVWWHSHANMGVFFSNTDDNTMNNSFSDVPWFISIVGNKKREYNVRFDLHIPIRMYVDRQNLYVWETVKVCDAWGCTAAIPRPEEGRWESYCPIHKSKRQDIDDAVKALVKKPVYKSTYKPNEKGSYKSSYSYDYSKKKGSESFHGKYKETKFCDASYCLNRVPLNDDYCDEHVSALSETLVYDSESGYGYTIHEMDDGYAFGEGYTVIDDSDDTPETAAYVKNEIKYGEECEISFCKKDPMILIQGILLCNAHGDDMVALEALVNIDIDDDYETVLEILEEYVRDKEEFKSAAKGG